jgi:hypothetical protein
VVLAGESLEKEEDRVLALSNTSGSWKSFPTTISWGSAQIMADIRHTARNLIRAIKGKAILKIRRKTAGWDDDYRFRAITQSWT